MLLEGLSFFARAQAMLLAGASSQGDVELFTERCAGLSEAESPLELRDIPRGMGEHAGLGLQHEVLKFLCGRGAAGALLLLGRYPEAAAAVAFMEGIGPFLRQSPHAKAAPAPLRAMIAHSLATAKAELLLLQCKYTEARTLIDSQLAVCEGEAAGSAARAALLCLKGRCLAGLGRHGAAIEALGLAEQEQKLCIARGKGQAAFEEVRQ
jgi:hypothetical protein